MDKLLMYIYANRSPNLIISSRHALGRSLFHCTVSHRFASTPRPHERQLFTAGLLPSGPRPFSATKAQKPSFRKASVPTPAPQDGVSQQNMWAMQQSKLLPLASPPAIDGFGLQITPSYPGQPAAFVMFVECNKVISKEVQYREKEMKNLWKN